MELQRDGFSEGGENRFDAVFLLDDFGQGFAGAIFTMGEDEAWFVLGQRFEPT